VPAYLVSRFAAQYRAIVEVLLEVQDTSLTGMAFDDVRAKVRAYLTIRLSAQLADELSADDAFALDARLSRLVAWGVLTRWQDPARTGEDFLRRRDRYQLTPEAARLHVFWTQEQDVDSDVAADLTLAPRAIRTRLETFASAVSQQNYRDAAREYQQVLLTHRVGSQRWRVR
jgi:hypothetical protein